MVGGGPSGDALGQVREGGAVRAGIAAQACEEAAELAELARVVFEASGEDAVFGVIDGVGQVAREGREAFDEANEQAIEEFER